MPAFMEYLDTLPSIYDLFEFAPQDLGSFSVPILYSDDSEDIEAEVAFVFQQRNEGNNFKQYDITELLNSKRKVQVKACI